MEADLARTVKKEVAAREPSARLAGGTPALHCAFTRKDRERGRLARIVGLFFASEKITGMRLKSLKFVVTQRSVI
jgi:hypothetical protein